MESHRGLDSNACFRGHYTAMSGRGPQKKSCTDGISCILYLVYNIQDCLKRIIARTITERDRAARSIIDHMMIIEALEKRETEFVEQLEREPALQLADHINPYVDYLE